jgi:hypothetical protein
MMILYIKVLIRILAIPTLTVYVKVILVHCYMDTCNIGSGSGINGKCIF